MSTTTVRHRPGQYEKQTGTLSLKSGHPSYRTAYPLLLTSQNHYTFKSASNTKNSDAFVHRFSRQDPTGRGGKVASTDLARRTQARPHQVKALLLSGRGMMISTSSPLPIVLISLQRSTPSTGPSRPRIGYVPAQHGPSQQLLQSGQERAYDRDYAHRVS